MTIFYCVEDQLSRAVAKRLIHEYCPTGTAIHELGKAYGGFGYIRKNLKKFYDLSQRSPVFIITDLDHENCAPSLRGKWLDKSGLTEPLPENMLFCVAQTEIESWLLADTTGISNFLKVSAGRLNPNIETTILDAKEYLVGLAKRSRDPTVRKNLTPDRKSTAATGLQYNYELSNFALEDWNPEASKDNSVSLRRAINKLVALSH